MSDHARHRSPRRGRYRAPTSWAVRTDGRSGRAGPPLPPVDGPEPVRQDHRAGIRGAAGCGAPGDRTGHLAALEGARWSEPGEGATRLVATVHALRRRPLAGLGVEELRLLIGQDVGLPHLLPLAVDLLCRDPPAEGDLHPGDLPSAVLGRAPEVWAARPDRAARLAAALRGAATASAPDLPEEARGRAVAFPAAPGPALGAE
ncbi:contact-dependent growth inhibition system immunity protein [Kitasatospora sp. NPDC097605]|uniref:contact-dependent growth inhibition system immunity protein n=1 Tax=Kitasatospora sp. NPDC097605 TaxID=3157226 RepID=UPI00332F22DC